MINSISSAYDYLNNYLNLTSSSTSNTQNFDDILDLADDTLKIGNENSATELSVGETTETDENAQVASAGGSGGGSDSSEDESNSDMDLNKDGVVTIDEIIQYYAMQAASENGGEENSFQSFNNESLNYNSAKTAYSSSNSFSTSTLGTDSLSLLA